MTGSKFFNITLLALVLVGAGCTKKRDSYGLEAVDVSGGVQDAETLEGWSLPTRRRINFYACLVDDQRRVPATPGSFEIRGGPARVVTSTDDRGCLRWSEDFVFNALARPVYLELRRTVIGLEKPFSNAELPLEIAVNPWSGLNGSEPAVVYLKFASVPRKVRGDNSTLGVLSDSSMEAQARVALTSLGGFELVGLNYEPISPRISLTAQPQFLVTDLQGGTGSVAVREGFFDVQIHLIREKDRVLLARSDWIHARLLAGAIRITEAPLHLLARPQMSDVGLVRVILRPRRPHPQGLGAVSQEFLIGGLAQPVAGAVSVSTAGSDSGQGLARPVPPTEIASLDRSALAPSQDGDGPAQTQTPLVHALRIESVGLDGDLNSRERAQDLSRDRRRVWLQVQARITTELNPGTAFPGRRFRVRRMQPQGQVADWIEVTANFAGVLTWVDSFEFDYHSPRGHCVAAAQNRELSIEVLDDRDARVRLTRRLLINPWSRDNPIIDVDAIGQVAVLPPGDGGGNCGRKPFLRIESQSTSPISNESEPLLSMDRRIRIGAVHHLQYTARLAMYFPDDPESPNVRELLRPGPYRVSLVLARPNALIRAGDGFAEGVDLVAAARFPVEIVQGGGLAATFAVRLADPLMAPVRNMALVQLEFLDEDRVVRDGLGRINLDQSPVLGNPPLETTPMGFQMFVNRPSSSVPLTSQLAGAPAQDQALTAWTHWLRAEGKTVAQLHDEYWAERRERDSRLDESLTVERLARAGGYRLRSVEQVMGGQQSRAAASPERLKAALDCMHTLSWGHWRHQMPKCILQDEELARLVQRLWCRDVPSRFNENRMTFRRGLVRRFDPETGEYEQPLASDPATAQRRQSEVRDQTERNRSNNTLAAMCEDPYLTSFRETLWFEKRIFVEEFSADGRDPSGRPQAEVGPGFSGELAVDVRGLNQISFGTLLQHEDLSRQRVTFSVDGAVRGALTQVPATLSAFSIEPGRGGGRVAAPAVATGGSRVLGLLRSNLAWKNDFLNWVQRFLVGANQSRIANQLPMVLERQDVTIRPRRYRECYLVHGMIPPRLRTRTVGASFDYTQSDWTKLRDMVCFPVRDAAHAPLEVRESFYALSQVISPQQGQMIDPLESEGVFFMKARGERDMTLIMNAIEEGMNPIHRDRLPLDAAWVMRNVRQRLERMRSAGEITNEAFDQGMAEVAEATERATQGSIAMDGMIAWPAPGMDEFEYFTDENPSEAQRRWRGWWGQIMYGQRYWVGARGSQMNVQDRMDTNSPGVRQREFYRRRASAGDQRTGGGN